MSSTEMAAIKPAQGVPSFAPSEPSGRGSGRAGAVRANARALPEHTRSHNRALVLQMLYRGTGLSRADLSRGVGLTRVTISDLVAELIAEDLVVELGPSADVRPGKPATLLDVNRSGFSILGLDLSDDARFHGAVTDLDGKVLHREQVDVAGSAGPATLEAAAALLERLSAAAKTPVLGVGVGSPGIVDAAGTVRTAPNLGWTNVPLEAFLRQRSGLEVQVANDANIAALAERTFGGAGEDVMVVRVGRGVGSGIMVAGSPVAGARFAAGEIGHVVVGTDGGDLCACGKSGCLETWLAIPRVEARLAAAPDGAARERVLREAGQRLGIALAPVVSALNLGEVVLGGPPEILDGPLLAGTAETLRNRTMADLHGDLTLRMTELGDDIVVLGAVVMVLTGQLGVY